MIFYYCAECSTQHSVNWWAMEGVCDPLREGSTHLFFSPSRLLCCLLQLLCLFVSCSDISEIVCVYVWDKERMREDTVYLTWSLQSVFKLWHFSNIFCILGNKCKVSTYYLLSGFFFLFICLLVCTLIFKSMGRRL